MASKFEEWKVKMGVQTRTVITLGEPDNNEGNEGKVKKANI